MHVEGLLQKLLDSLQPSHIFALLLVKGEIVEVLQEVAVHANISLEKIFKACDQVRVEL